MEDNEKLFYGKFAPIVESAENRILCEIRRIIGDMTPSPEFSPAEHIRSRIKSSGSICDKLTAKGLPCDISSAMDNIHDIIGIRIVTHFVGDVYSVFAHLKGSPLWTVENVKDYIESPKKNGYRSLHMIIRLAPEIMGTDSISAEIQLRTVAMDTWASLEHQLKYKKNIRNTSLIVSELRRCADELASTDLSMQTLREMIQGE